MKKNLFFCILMMLVCLCPQEVLAQSSKGVHMSLTGKIGDSEGFLSMNGLNGTYSYDLPNGKVERRLEFVSYDKKTKRLVLKAKDKNFHQLQGRENRFRPLYGLSPRLAIQNRLLSHVSSEGGRCGM